MDKETQHRLNELNQDFYQKTAQYFNATRKYNWAGWEHFWSEVSDNLPTQPSVLDLGCGNGRFVSFLQEKLAGRFKYLGIDTSPELLNYTEQYASEQINFQQQDLLELQLSAQKFDLIALFGVMHHIPGIDNRIRLLQKLAKSMSTGGFIVISFWQFLLDERYKSRLQDWSTVDIEEKKLEHNDFLLDWQKGLTAFRYAHFADQDEIDLLIETSKLHKVSEFLADGKSEKLNKYIILKK